MRTTLVTLSVSAVIFTLASASSAAPEWVERRIVLSGTPIAGSVDVGMGVGHTEVGRYRNGFYTANGAGFSAEGVIGIVGRVDLGLRVGLRVNDESAYAQSDSYARFYDPNAPLAYTHGYNTFANPEFRVRGKLVDVGVFELGLEGRAIVPTFGTRFSTVFGVPMAVHAGHFFKLDFGVYNVLGFDNPIVFALEVPVNAWFQVTRKVFLGPMTGFRVYSNYFANEQVDVMLGFGLGVHLVRWLDLKTQIVFPRINEGPQFFGGGVGVGFIFE